MVKILNILFAIIICLSCTKDKVPASPFLDDALTFLLGEWQWEKSITQLKIDNENYYEHVKAEDSGKSIQLSFQEKGILSVTENETVNHYALEDYFLFKVGNNTVIKILIKDEVIVFIYNNVTQKLSTGKAFFSLEVHVCSWNNQILNNEFKKL